MKGHESIRVRVRAFGVLGSLLPGRETTVTGPAPVTVGQVLKTVCRRNPDLTCAVLSDQGELLSGVQVFVNGQNARHAQGLSTPVPDRAEVLVLRGDVVGG